MFQRLLLPAVVLLAGLASGAASAAATNDKLTPFVSVGGVYTYQDDEARLSDDGAGVFVTAGLPVNRYLSFELGVSTQEFDAERAPNINEWEELSAELNALFTYPFGRGWIPYVSAGLGATESDLAGGEAPTTMHYVVGGGTFKFISFKSFDLGLRADIRYRLIDFDQEISGDENPGVNDRFDEGQVRLGVVVPFGRVVRGDIDTTRTIRETTTITNTVLVGDADGDGVVDAKDKCPDTPAGTVVDGNGCPDKSFLKALGSVYFDTDKDTLTPTVKKTLDAIAVEAASMKSGNAKVVIEVNGHADQRGTDEYNYALSERRAKAVAGYLSEKGVSYTRIKIVASGENDPVATGAGSRDLAKNRRVDIKAYDQ